VAGRGYCFVAPISGSREESEAVPAVAADLREATQRHYGVAGRAYLREVVPAMNHLQQQVADITKLFVNRRGVSTPIGTLSR